MRRLVLRRLAQAVLVLWAAYTITFIILYLVPGDPVQMMLNGNGGGSGAVINPAQLAQLRAQYGFNKPAWEQYLLLLGRALRGNLGRSIDQGSTVVHLIAANYLPTVELALFAALIGFAVGTLLALAASVSRGWLQNLLLSLPAIGVSVPTFWVGFLLIELFAFRLRWFPSAGNQGFGSLVLPAVTLAIPAAATTAQLLARNLAWTLGQPFITTIRAKGAGELRLQIRHGLRNACLPVVTMAALIVGNMLAGAVVVETVFSRQGIGQVLALAVEEKDIPVVQGLVLLAAFVFVVINLFIDLLYPRLDPRVRPERAARVTSPVAGPVNRAWKWSR
jgi:peptide/nickel transport system permease protein